MEELKRRRASSRGALIKLATVLGVLAPAPRNQTYGITLRGTF
jgi:hypothetical protein